MNKILKIALITTSAVFVLLIAAVLVIVNVDPNNHKLRIADQFREQTGRELTLGGEIGLTLYPWLGVSLEDVAISNAAGFGTEPLFAAESAEVRIKLLPLLRQHYEIDTVKLYGARINLAVAADGRSNWADLVATPDTAASTDTGAIGSPFTFGNVILGGVDIQDASLAYQDDIAGVRYDISAFSFKTGALVYGQPIDLNISLQAAASKPALAADIGLNGTLFYDLDSGRYELAPLALNTRLEGANLPNGAADISLTTAIRVDLDADSLQVEELALTALGTQLQATIQGQAITSTAAVYKTSLQLQGDDLAVLFKAAEIEPLATQLAGLSNRQFEFATELTFDNGRAAADISTLRANLLGTTLEGTFQASELQSSAPVVSGKLLASGPDLPTVVEVLGQVSGGRNSPLSQAGRDLRQVSSKNFAVDAQFDANLRTGTVNVPTLDLRLLGASINGNLAASNVQSDNPLLRGKLLAAGPDLPLLLQIVGRLQGVDSALFQHAGKLSSVRTKTFSVDAEFDADLERGTISIPTFNAAALGFTVNGNVASRDLSGRNGTISGAVSLRGENLQGLLAAYEQPELGEVLQSVALQFELSGSSTALSVSPLTASAVLSGNRIPNSPVTVTFNSGGRMNLDQESLDVDSFTLAGLGLNVAGKVNANTLFTSPTFAGELSIASFNLRRLLQQLNQTLPEMADPRTLEIVSLDANFSGTDASLNLSNVNLLLDQTRLSGSASVSNYETTNVEFDLALSELDADRYLAPTATGSGSATVSDAPTEIPVELLRGLNVKGALAVDKLTLSGLQVADLALGINATGGDVLLSPLNMNLYEGSFAGKLGLDATGPLALASVSANLEGVNLAPLLVDFMDATYVSGQGNVQLSLEAAGNDTGVLKSSLNGTGKIALEDGVLTGVDVASVLGQVETMLRSRRVAELQRGQQTAFETFGATLTITNGVIASNDLLIKSPGIQIAGRGNLLDLNTNAIGYNMVTSVDKSTATRDTREYDIGGYSVPIACTGTLDAPRCLPDAGEIVRTALAREAERRVGDLIQRTLGTPTATPTETGTPQGEVEATNAEPAAAPAAPADPATQILNRALNRILN